MREPIDISGIHSLEGRRLPLSKDFPVVFFLMALAAQLKLSIGCLWMHEVRSRSVHNRPLSRHNVKPERALCHLTLFILESYKGVR